MKPLYLSGVPAGALPWICRRTLAVSNGMVLGGVHRCASKTEIVLVWRGNVGRRTHQISAQLAAIAAHTNGAYQGGGTLAAAATAGAGFAAGAGAGAAGAGAAAGLAGG
jgi:hypothetical protein